MNLPAMERQVAKLTAAVSAFRNLRIDGFERHTTPGGMSFVPKGAQKSPIGVRQFWVRNPASRPDGYPDTILCDEVESPIGGTTHVAKPYLLRKTPWANGQTRDGKRFTYTTNEERDSISVTDENDKEHQVITPSYKNGDVIYAMALVAGRDAELKDADGLLVHTQWVDLNVDGRCWAKGSA